jgi:ATP-dependent DNA ligase
VETAPLDEGKVPAGEILLNLPLTPPYPPMEALLVDEIPEGAVWQYEPKWDGFRCVAFKDGDKVELQSKSGQPLARYFPDVVENVSALAPPRFILDGEIVIPAGKAFSFDDLLQRIHPAESRVRKLAKEFPATFIVFDLLADEKGRALAGETLAVRRQKLEAFARKHFKDEAAMTLSPATTDPKVAKKWLAGVGVRLDGIVAKRLDMPYQSGNRTGMQKVKLMRTADCVVGGFRYGTGSKTVGSFLLGLYDKKGLLQHVGFCSTIKAGERAEVTKRLEALIAPPGFTGRAPGGPSRWSTERSGEWQPLKPSLVVEVRYDHYSQGRFRHGTKLLRFRPDKLPSQCTLEQVERRGRA